ncbi:coiled-coil domain-containing protein 103-like [Hydractinia symbiolongicarpus]|uniref:coiled-coil domain-containing protein 103-like n=1 Tax=Hydractinia symbiolongicarpus TaxID=13093 RepID=UPI00254A9AEE|nr:coiled-coil domain-containing protein 103-like [Hydractinia symbiolongicarpus]
MDSDVNINFKKLEKEFITAKNADAAYSRENDAKFRAVHQKVGSYEEFRDIVAASHLKPLDRKDILGTDTVKQTWNPLYSSNIAGVTPVLVDVKTPAVEAIDLCDQFMKRWKTLKSDEDKYEFMLSYEADVFKRVFFVDIPSNVLEYCIKIFNEHVTDTNYSHISRILLSFTNSQRFNLTLKFFSKREKETICSLLNKLEHFGCRTDELKKLYLC